MALLQAVAVRPRRVRPWPALLVLLGASGCGGGAAGAESASLDPDRPYDLLALMPPSELPAPEADAPETAVTGAQFRADLLAESVRAEDTRARFQPRWTSSTPAAERRLSAAFYFLEGAHLQSDAAELLLDWSAPPRLDDLWVGMADFREDRWIWRRLADVSEVPLPQRARYQRAADGVMACVLLVLGGTDSVLDGIDSGGDSPQDSLLNVGYPLGTNLEALSDWSTSLPFTDAFKCSREWIPQLVGTSNPWNTGAEVRVDRDGWVTSLGPGEAVMTMMLTDQDDVAPAGRYVCLYEGDAGQGAAAIQISGSGAKVPGSWTPGRFEIEVGTASNALYFKIEAINPSDYLRNIRVVLPGYEATFRDADFFHPAFLQSLEPFRVLRFMDWGRTNDSPQASWSKRPRAGACRYTTAHGVPLEVMIDLCNRTRKDMWYCVPHQADDDYVRRAVKLIRDRLDPRLRLHLEYSNEVWNWIFQQAQWAHARGLEIWPGDSAAWLKYYGLRAAQVMDVAAAAFADQTPGRLVRILATQSQNPGAGVVSLDVQVGGPGDLAHGHADVLAVAPYLGNELGMPANEAATMAMSVTDVLNFLAADSALKNGPGGVTEINRANAAARGLALAAYEGGQHLVGVGSVVNNQVITDLFVAANRHARMRELYFADLTRWTRRDGGLYMAFTHTYRPGKYGSWGFLETVNQPRATAYKWLGILDWLDTVYQQ